VRNKARAKFGTLLFLWSEKQSESCGQSEKQSAVAERAGLAT
jgi:hypothetical protein